MQYSFDGRTPSIGNGTYISDGAIVIGDVNLGEGCYVGPGAILRGDYGRIEIGAGSAVEEGVIVHVGPDDVCRIGELVTMGHGAIFHGKTIGDYGVIGMGAVVSIDAEIGVWAIIAEGAVVKHGQVIPERVVAAGNPARVVRKINEKDEEWWRWGKQLYVDLAKKYLRLGLQRID